MIKGIVLSRAEKLSNFEKTSTFVAITSTRYCLVNITRFTCISQSMRNATKQCLYAHNPLRKPFTIRIRFVEFQTERKKCRRMCNVINRKAVENGILTMEQ